MLHFLFFSFSFALWPSAFWFAYHPSNFLYIVHSSTALYYACTVQISFNGTVPHILEWDEIDDGCEMIRHQIFLADHINDWNKRHDSYEGGKIYEWYGV
jgi:hypothetical protein